MLWQGLDQGTTKQKGNSRPVVPSVLILPSVCTAAHSKQTLQGVWSCGGENICKHSHRDHHEEKMEGNVKYARMRTAAEQLFVSAADPVVLQILV